MNGSQDSLEAIVQDYVRQYRDAAAKELRWFNIQKTLPDAVRRAGMAEGPMGRRLHHQRRIPRRVLEASTRLLLERLPELEACATFDQLFYLVGETIDPLPGIGELTVYDTALRIGAKLNMSPERVYLHAGTRWGARALGLDHARVSLLPTELPVALRVLEPHEMEDLLCMYKSRLQKLQASFPGSLS